MQTNKPLIKYKKSQNKVELDISGGVFHRDVEITCVHSRNNPTMFGI